LVFVSRRFVQTATVAVDTTDANGTRVVVSTVVMLMAMGLFFGVSAATHLLGYAAWQARFPPS
jgi:transcriptional regulator GlxA family with amidase domain